jgi:PelA/Pel-15E family pectate lyase
MTTFAMRAFLEIPRLPSTSRVSFLLVGFGLALLTACDVGSAPPPPDAGTGGTTATATGGSSGSSVAGSSGTGTSSSGGGTGGTGVAIECAPAAVPVMVPWSAVNQQAAAFYATPEALTLAGNILYYQNVDHGWPKDTDMTTRTQRKSRSTIDNSATTTQIQYLSRVYEATQCPEFRDAAVSGIEYLFSGQYDNGGWPQEFPDGDDYHTHITFNDNAMIHVLELLRSISEHAEPFAYLDESYAPRAAESVARGIECILACQIVEDGEKVVWCAQHDEVTLEPAQARTYELPSLSGSESVGIVRFLMSIDDPSPEVREAIEGAVAWFEAVKITGIRVDSIDDSTQPTGEDRVVVEDPAAAPLWARFYELGTNRPIFSSRCEVPECDDDPFYMRRYSLAEIDNERRVGYAWYGDWPNRLLSTDYPAWRAAWGE